MKITSEFLIMSTIESKRKDSHVWREIKSRTYNYCGGVNGSQLLLFLLRPSEVVCPAVSSCGVDCVDG